MSTDGYDVWRRLLKGERPPIHEGESHCGYFAIRRKHGVPSALAIFRDEDSGELVAHLAHDDSLVPDEITDPDRIHAYYQRGYAAAVSYEVFNTRMETGVWPHIDATVQQAEATIGHNAGPEMTPFEQEAANLRELMVATSKYAEVRDDDTAIKATTLWQSIGKVLARLEKMRKEEKEPHLKAGQEVDERFRTVCQPGKEAADAVKRALSAHETRKLQEERRRQAEAARKAEEERRAAEAERERLREAVKAGDADALETLLADQPPPSYPAPEPEPPPVSRIVTGMGRAAAVRTRMIVTVTDMARVAPRYYGNPDLVALVTKLAQADVEAGRSFEGIITDEVAEVRR